MDEAIGADTSHLFDDSKFGDIYTALDIQEIARTKKANQREDLTYQHHCDLLEHQLRVLSKSRSHEITAMRHKLHDIHAKTPNLVHYNTAGNSKSANEARSTGRNRLLSNQARKSGLGLKQQELRSTDTKKSSKKDGSKSEGTTPRKLYTVGSKTGIKNNSEEQVLSSLNSKTRNADKRPLTEMQMMKTGLNNNGYSEEQFSGLDAKTSQNVEKRPLTEMHRKDRKAFDTDTGKSIQDEQANNEKVSNKSGISTRSRGSGEETIKEESEGETIKSDNNDKESRKDTLDNNSKVTSAKTNDTPKSEESKEEHLKHDKSDKEKCKDSSDNNSTVTSENTKDNPNSEESKGEHVKSNKSDNEISKDTSDNNDTVTSAKTKDNPNSQISSRSSMQSDSIGSLDLKLKQNPTLSKSISTITGHTTDRPIHKSTTYTTKDTNQEYSKPSKGKPDRSSSLPDLCGYIGPNQAQGYTRPNHTQQQTPREKVVPETNQPVTAQHNSVKLPKLRRKVNKKYLRKQGYQKPMWFEKDALQPSTKSYIRRAEYVAKSLGDLYEKRQTFQQMPKKDDSLLRQSQRSKFIY